MSNLFSNIIESSGVLKQVDLIEISCLDLNSGKIEISSFGNLANNGTEYYFDLASVTKILTNGLIGLFSRNQIDDNLKYCLEHSSGIPSWGLLSKNSWQSEIESFDIKKSETLYSDYGAIRAMLLYERISGENLYSKCRKFWDKDIFHWLEVREMDRYLVTGQRKSDAIMGDVHDPNAFNIRHELSHAGLFGTSRGLLNTIKNIFESTEFRDFLINSKKSHPTKRFHFGWDTPSGENSLAGEGCSSSTFGHLGFTGASVWVDLEKNKALSILSNVTRDGWFKKTELNQVRRAVGKIIWS